MKINFDNACKLIVGRAKTQGGIGTLGEKTLHAVLKHTFMPDPEYHEIKVGKYYADIANEMNIIEIQTRNFNALRKKLSFFLENHIVTVVYPIANKKHLIWIDKETGEITKKRKSPKVGTVYDSFYELYKIKELLTHPNFRFCIILLDVTEYRNLDGWSHDKKKGSSRYERIPENLIDTILLNSINDFRLLIPNTLPEYFTASDFKKAAKLNTRNAQSAINVLKYVKQIEQTGKKGRAFLYKVINPE